MALWQGSATGNVPATASMWTTSWMPSASRVLLAGLGLSGYMSPNVAMGFLIAYFLVNIEIYLATYTLGVFKLSYGVMGPTEMRVIVCIGNLVLLTQKNVRIGENDYLLCDVSGVVAIVVLLAIAIVVIPSKTQNGSTTKNAFREGRLGRMAEVQCCRDYRCWSPTRGSRYPPERSGTGRSGWRL